MSAAWLNALMGGVLIGTSVSLMLLWSGRVTGISGILNGLLAPLKGDTLWRASFILGLVVGGFALRLMIPNVFENTVVGSPWLTVIAGVLVGFGTIMGSGCTSGHGVCGISRFSPRSLVATLVFISAGMIAVRLFKTMGVLE